MEKLTERFESLVKAIITLEKGIELYNTRDLDDEDLHAALRDSLIQRFEFCVDLSWKVMQKFLDIFHGIAVNSPKVAFRECHKVEIFTEEETKKALDMVDARNLTSHTYHEDLADQISASVPSYLPIMKKVISHTQPQVEKTYK